MVSGFRQCRAKFQGKGEIRRVGMADFKSGNVTDSGHAPQPWRRGVSDPVLRIRGDYNKPPLKMYGRSRMGIGCLPCLKQEIANVRQWPGCFGRPQAWSSVTRVRAGIRAPLPVASGRRIPRPASVGVAPAVLATRPPHPSPATRYRSRPAPVGNRMDCAELPAASAFLSHAPTRARPPRRGVGCPASAPRQRCPEARFQTSTFSTTAASKAARCSVVVTQPNPSSNRASA